MDRIRWASPTSASRCQRRGLQRRVGGRASRSSSRRTWAAAWTWGAERAGSPPAALSAGHDPERDHPTDLTEGVAATVTVAIASSWISQGPCGRAFEEAFAARIRAAPSRWPRRAARRQLDRPRCDGDLRRPPRATRRTAQHQGRGTPMLPPYPDLRGAAEPMC